MRCGDYDIASDNDNVLLPYFQKPIESISIHPKYQNNRGRITYNLALLHLESDLKLQANIDTIRLPELNQNGEVDYEKSDCVVLGWGEKASDRSKTQDNMKEVQPLEILDKTVCETKLQAHTKKNTKVRASTLCALGDQGVDACYGDGGGPLVCPRKNAGDSLSKYVVTIHSRKQ